LPEPPKATAAQELEPSVSAAAGDDGEVKKSKKTARPARRRGTRPRRGGRKQAASRQETAEDDANNADDAPSLKKPKLGEEEDAPTPPDTSPRQRDESPSQAIKNETTPANAPESLDGHGGRGNGNEPPGAVTGEPQLPATVVSTSPQESFSLFLDATDLPEMCTHFSAAVKSVGLEHAHRDSDFYNQLRAKLLPTLNYKQGGIFRVCGPRRG
jgi:hypothetical protein